MARSGAWLLGLQPLTTTAYPLRVESGDMQAYPIAPRIPLHSIRAFPFPFPLSPFPPHSTITTIGWSHRSWYSASSCSREVALTVQVRLI